MKNKKNSVEGLKNSPDPKKIDIKGSKLVLNLTI